MESLEFGRAVGSRPCRRSSTRPFGCSDRSRSPRFCRRPRSSTSPRSSTGPASPTSRSRAAAASTSAVKRGVESPWERIRAIRARTRTPLALALRGRFLVGSRPVGGDFVRRFVASAAESGIDVFRLHDPLNDVSNLREASEAITAAEREFDAGLVYSPGPSGETDALVAQAQAPARSSARPAILIHDPSGSLEPHRVRELVEAIREVEQPPGRLLLPGRRRRRARRRDRGGPRRRRPDRLRRLPGCPRPASRVRRGAGERARRPRPRDRRLHRPALARLGSRRRAHQRPAGRAARAAHRDPRRRAQPSGRADRRDRPPPPHPRRGRPARRGDRRAGDDPRRGRIAAARRSDRPGARVAGPPARARSRALPDRRRRAAGADPGALRLASRCSLARRRAGGLAGLERGSPRGHARPRRAPQAPQGARRERGGAPAARAVRRRRRAAPAHDPRTRHPGVARRGRGRRRAAPSGSARSSASSRTRASAR